jgi:hypothetical protein
VAAVLSYGHGESVACRPPPHRPIHTGYAGQPWHTGAWHWHPIGRLFGRILP